MNLDKINGFDLEDLLRAESEAIDSFLRRAGNKGRRVEAKDVDIRRIEQRDLGHITEKNEFIRAAALLTMLLLRMRIGKGADYYLSLVHIQNLLYLESKGC